MRQNRNQHLPADEAKRKLRNVSHPLSNGIGRTGFRKFSLIQQPMAGLCADLYINDDFEYRGDVCGKTFSGRDGREVEKAMIAALAGVGTPTWVPIIVVSGSWDTGVFSDGEKLRQSVDIGIERGHVGVINGKMLWAEWDSPVDERLDGNYHGSNSNYGDTIAPDGVIALPAHHEHMHFFNYDEATWAGLLGLVAATKNLKEKLAKLLESPGGIKQIAARGGQLLLGA